MQDSNPANERYTPHQLSLAFPENTTVNQGNNQDLGENPEQNQSEDQPVDKIGDHQVQDCPLLKNQTDNRNNNPNHYLFVDLETGGLYPDKHPVLQIAATITDLDFKIKAHFMSYIQPCPKLEITEEALAINQLKREDLQSAFDEKSVALALHHFANLGTSTARFAGYNCQFDLEFLACIWQRHNLLPAPYYVPWFDVYAVAKAKLASDSGLSNFKLASVATYFGLNTAGAHDAVQDLIMTIEIAKLLKSMPGSNGTADLETIKFSM